MYKDKRNRRRVTLLVSAQTLSHLQKMSRDCGMPPGEVIDAMMIETLRAMKNQNNNYCVCCGDEIPEGRLVCPACEKGMKP